MGKNKRRAQSIEPEDSNNDGLIPNKRMARSTSNKNYRAPGSKGGSLKGKIRSLTLKMEIATTIFDRSTKRITV